MKKLTILAGTLTFACGGVSARSSPGVENLRSNIAEVCRRDTALRSGETWVSYLDAA